MEIFKDNKSIVIKASCTIDEISDVITVLEELRKEMPAGNRSIFPMERPIERFLAHCRNYGFPQGFTIKL